MAQVELGTGGVTSTLSSLKQIVDVISDTARSVQEQAVVSDEIARNMDAVQKIAQEVLGSSEEAVVQGEQLHALAIKLEELVRGFRVEAADANAANGNGAGRALATRSDGGAARAIERAAQDGAGLERVQDVLAPLVGQVDAAAGLDPPRGRSRRACASARRALGVSDEEYVARAERDAASSIG